MFEAFINWFANLSAGSIVAFGMAIILIDFARGAFELDAQTLEIRQIYGRKLIGAAAVIAGLLLMLVLATFDRARIVQTMNETLFRYDRTGTPTAFMVWFHVIFASVLYALLMLIGGEAVAKLRFKHLVVKKRKAVELARQSRKFDFEVVPLSGQPGYDPDYWTKVWDAE